MLWVMIKGSMVGYTIDDHCSSFDEDGVCLCGIIDMEMEQNAQGEGIFVQDFMSPVEG